jgi:mRNA degradation ribonuclease J1/J2
MAFDIKDAKDIPLDKILFICAGSQGDYRSALSRIVKGEH